MAVSVEIKLNRPNKIYYENVSESLSPSLFTIRFTQNAFFHIQKQ